MVFAVLAGFSPARNMGARSPALVIRMALGTQPAAAALAIRTLEAGLVVIGSVSWVGDIGARNAEVILHRAKLRVARDESWRHERRGGSRGSSHGD